MRVTPLSHKFIVVAATLLAAISIFLLPIAPVYADGASPNTQIPGLGRIPNSVLTGMLMREKNWYDDQGTLLRQANDLAKGVQSLISNQKGKGRDVTDLEAALLTYQKEILVAQEVHAESGKILGTNAGFNSKFEVVDRISAGQTFFAARESLRNTHYLLVKATLEIERAYHTWRVRMLALGK